MKPWYMIVDVAKCENCNNCFLACKDERNARYAYLLGGLLILPVGFISALIGMAAAAMHHGIEPATALPAVALGMPPLAAGLILSGLWAADVSTASALLMGSATLVSSDIIKRFFVPDLDPKRDQRLCRITDLGAAELRREVNTLVRMGLIVEDKQQVIELNRFVQHMVAGHLAMLGLTA